MTVKTTRIIRVKNGMKFDNPANFIKWLVESSGASIKHVIDAAEAGQIITRNMKMLDESTLYNEVLYTDEGWEELQKKAASKKLKKLIDEHPDIEVVDDQIKQF